MSSTSIVNTVTTKPASTFYSIPMKGNGNYNAHSELQKEVLAKALPLLHEATVKATDNPSSATKNLLRVIEYGASHGANSILPLETILKATSRTILIVEMNDRPENDFNTLSLTIDKWLNNINKADYPHEIHIALRPGSFYKPLNAVQELELGFCFTCLHFLEDIPRFAGSHFAAARTAEVRDLLQKQADYDLRKFLRLRSSEFVRGGQLLVSLIASGFGNPDFMDSGPGDSVRVALRNMSSEKILTQQEVNDCIVPIYFRSEQDIKSTIEADEINEKWTVVKMDKSQAMHPFWEDLEAQKRKGNFIEEHSVGYARAMVIWFLAVFEGFFSRALANNQNTHSLLEELKERAIRVFLEKYKDDPVYLSSVYVHFERKP